MKLTKPILFKGDGTSLWGKSKGTFRVTNIGVNYLRLDPTSKNPLFGEVQMFGLNLQWKHYTDNGIAKQANRAEVLKVIIALLKEKGVKNPRNIKLDWSEQGMQPAKGWSFDMTGEYDS